MLCIHITRRFILRSTNYTPFELIYGYPPRIPNLFSKPVEPQYNYDDYQCCAITRFI